MIPFRWHEALGSLIYLASFALIIAFLSRGEAVLVPLALACFLAFVLTPPVRALERRFLPRTAAVVLVMALTLGLLGGFGYLLNRQLVDLAAQMPEYSRAIRVKLAAVRDTRGSLTSIQEAIEKVSDDLDRQAAAQPGRRSATGVQRVQVVPDEPSDMERLVATIGPVFEPLATAVIVLVLTGFMLMKREDLRNRFIRLVGQGRITVTTRMLDEAGQRISTYLLTQTLINAVFGAVITAGLFLIGLPYAALWGFAAALLRFVPFIGVFLATVMPTALAFVQFEAWTPTLGTLGLFLVVDLATAHVVEPLVIGQRTGVSSLALLIMALLWTWLWGPIGLVLATPITVCLVALGKYVPSLEFLSVALADTPPLPAHAAYYQRLIACDDDEAGEIVEQELSVRPRVEVFDEVLIPALAWAARDRSREDISDAEVRFVLDVTRVVLNETAEGDGEADGNENGETPAAPVEAEPGWMLGVPARGAADALALEMLGRVLDPGCGRFEVAADSVLAAELIARIRADPPLAVCIGSLPPGGLHRARYLAKRLRAAVPHVRILVLRPRADFDEDASAARLRDAGADVVATSLADALPELERLIKAARLQQNQPVAASA